jgi:hypothetical protein
MVADSRGLARMRQGNGKADSSATLRNDKTGNGNDKPEVGMTNRK